MKKSITLILDDQDLLELEQLILDEGAEGSLAFLKRHLKGKALELLEGG